MTEIKRMNEWLESMENPAPRYPGLTSPIGMVHQQRPVVAANHAVSPKVLSWFNRTFRRANRRIRESSEDDASTDEPVSMSQYR